MRFGLLALLALALATPGARAGETFAPTAVARGAGSSVEIAHWQIQSSAKAQQGGAEISSGGFTAADWYPVSGRATVMAGLLENGKYPDVFHDDNLRAVEVPDAGHHQFVVPWWYRTQFNLTNVRGLHTLVRSNGLIASADVWVNGHEVASHADVAGA
jgi:exo-1,4-beta-D-glucosaminidase